jgi:hypothetical protein
MEHERGAFKVNRQNWVSAVKNSELGAIFGWKPDAIQMLQCKMECRKFRQPTSAVQKPFILLIKQSFLTAKN